MIKSRLGAIPVVMQLPIGAETEFKGVIDLIEMNALIWRDESLGAQWDVVEIPEDMRDQAEEYRELLIETVVEADEAAMEAYLNGVMPDNDQIRALVRRGTIDVKFHPMFCGTAFKNKGVQPLLDAVCDYLPSPVDIPAIKGIDVKTEGEIERHASDEEPLSMLAFKIMNDPFVGSLTFARIYSGKLEKGTSVMNTVKEKRERVGRMLQMHSNSREDIEEAFAGDIVALAGLKETTTGDTLCDPLKRLSSSAWNSPSRSSRSRSSRSPRATRKRWASRSTAWLPKTRPSASRPMRIRPDDHRRHGRTSPRHHR